MSDFLAQANAALEARARAFEARKAVLDDATLTDADKRSRVEAIDADMDARQAEADQFVKLAEREADNRAIQERAARLAGGRAPETRGDAAPAEGAQLRALARGEVRELDLRAAVSPATTANTSAAVPHSFLAQIMDTMVDRSPFFSLARRLTTSSGETIDWPVKVRTSGRAITPKSPATNFKATEGSAISKGEAQYTTASLGVFKYGVIVQASRELVEDERVDIVAELAADAGADLIDEITAGLLVGTGTGEMTGWATAATDSGITAPATLSAVTADNLIDLNYAITAPYRRNAVYMVNDAMVKQLRKVKGSDGQYLWQPALTAGAPDTFNGKSVLTDPLIATSGANAKVALFGDPNKYLARVVNGVRVVRSDEYGYDSDLISFKVTLRVGGILLDAASVRSLKVAA